MLAEMPPQPPARSPVPYLAEHRCCGTRTLPAAGPTAMHHLCRWMQRLRHNQRRWESLETTNRRDVSCFLAGRRSNHLSTAAPHPPSQPPPRTHATSTLKTLDVFSFQASHTHYATQKSSHRAHHARCPLPHGGPCAGHHLHFCRSPPASSGFGRLHCPLSQWRHDAHYDCRWQG